MIIKETINVRGDRLIDGLIPALRIMSKAEKTEDDTLTVDFTDTVFVSPVFVLSSIVYLSKCGKHVLISNVNDYLKTIGLDTGGIHPDEMRESEFKAKMEGYSGVTYIPIINFPARTNDDSKEAISTIVENIIIRQSNIAPNVAQGIKYMVDETLDNITEHSESDRGFIYAQAYPKKRYLDICIADRGITLLGSYKRLPDNEISTDLEAIKAANRGISSKNLPEAENRGYGIYTSKRMLINGLGGEYLMISGSNFYYMHPGADGIYNLPDGLRWNGTIVALRIPYKDSKFNYINYIE